MGGGRRGGEGTWFDSGKMREKSIGREEWEKNSSKMAAVVRRVVAVRPKSPSNEKGTNLLFLNGVISGGIIDNV